MENSDSSIASRVATCLKDFRNLHDALEENTPQEFEVASLLKGLLADNIGRFKVWAANVGAHQFARKSSLDYRLKDAPQIKNSVVRLLDDLSGMLLEGENLVSWF